MCPMSAARSTYRVGEFARLAGVTPRALHHYDRLGLLKPQRNSAGYRVYTDAHLERLVQIVALKFVGIPLAKIRRLAATGSGDLAAALHAQRQVLEEKRQLLGQAVAAIQAAEDALRADGRAAPSLYRKIIEVIEMENHKDWNAKYQQVGGREDGAAQGPFTGRPCRAATGVVRPRGGRPAGTD